MPTANTQGIKIEPRKGGKLTAIALITSILIPPVGFICAIIELVRIHLNKKEQLVDKYDKACKIISIIAIVLSITSTTILINWQMNGTAPWQLEEERMHTIEIQDALQENLDPLVDIADEDKELIGQAIQSAFEQNGIDTVALNLSGKDLANWAFDNIEYTLDNFDLNNKEGKASVLLHIKHRDMKSFMEDYTSKTEEEKPSNTSELGDIIHTAMDNTDYITEDLTLNLIDNHNGTWSITNESMSNLVVLLFGGIENQANTAQQTAND